MPVPTRITDLSATAASNSPAGSDSIGTSLDDYLRAGFQIMRGDLATKGADIASASTTDLGAIQGLAHDITGTTSITSFGTVAAGIWKICKFEGALTLTHNATSLILPGAANITTAAGDVGIFMSEGSGNWRCLSYMKADGSHLGPVLAAEVATTSGTSHDVSIPSWAKKITIMFVAVSTDGTSIPIIQLADSGGVEDTGYNGAACGIAAGPAFGTATAYSSGFLLGGAHAATTVLHGKLELVLQDAAGFTWVGSGLIGRSDAALLNWTVGSKALSAALSSIRLTTVNGTDAFDAGSFSVMYE